MKKTLGIMLIMVLILIGCTNGKKIDSKLSKDIENKLVISKKIIVKEYGTQSLKYIFTSE